MFRRANLSRILLLTGVPAAMVAGLSGCHFSSDHLWDGPAAHTGTVPLNRVLRPLNIYGNLDSHASVAAVERANAEYYYLLGQDLSAQGQSEQAIIAYERVRKLDPSSSFIHFTLAQEYLKRGLATEGVAMARKAVELDPQDRDSKMLLANLYSTAKKYPEARVLFSEVIAKDPNDEEAVLYLALLEIEQKNVVQARSRLKNYLKENPESAVGYFYLGRLEQETQHPVDAEKDFQKAIEIRPGFVQAGAYLASLYEEGGKKDLARDTYAWLAAQTDSSIFHKKLAEIYLDQHDYAGAQSALENCVRLDPMDLNSQVKLGLLYVEHKQFDEAIKQFRHVLKDSPDSDNIRFYLGAVYDQMGHASEAQHEYERIPFKSKLFPEAIRSRTVYLRNRHKNAEALSLLDANVANAQKNGQMHLEDLREIQINFLDSLDRTAEAHAALDRALKEFPGSERFLYLRGTLFEKTGEHDRAEAVMGELIAKNPQHAGALNFVGYLWAEKGVHLGEAENYIRRALKVRPKDPFITDSLGWVLYQRGRYRDALSALNEAFAARPDEAVIADHLGDVLVKLGRIQDAKKYYETALKLGPEKDTDRKNLESKLLKLGTPPVLQSRQGESRQSSLCAAGQCPQRLRNDARQPAKAQSN